MTSLCTTAAPDCCTSQSKGRYCACTRIQSRLLSLYIELHNRKNINLQTTTQFSNFGSLLFDTLLHGLCNDVRKFCKEMQLNNSKGISGIIFSFTYYEKSNKYFDYIIKPKPKNSWNRNL